MCGIAGHYSSAIGGSDAFMSTSPHRFLRHRGPDDTGYFFSADGSLALFHTRLAIQDLSPLGHQPMLSDDGAVVIILNGEIYNFKELRSELESAGHRFIGGSDTEVLLRLYLAHGELQDLAPVLSRLNGIFAFALWDSRFDVLWLARDPFGVKPLYYSQSGGGVAFASELKSLQSMEDISHYLDPTALDQYLTYIWAPGERTPALNIRKLGPGEVLRIRQGEIVEHLSWYNRPSSRSLKPLTPLQAIRGTEQHLRQAVHRQMVSDVPVGAFLSGGLDSSSIVAFAREITPNLQCFTIDVPTGYSEGLVSDLPYACRVAKHLGVPLHVVNVDAAQLAAELDAMVWHLDEPLADPAALNVLHISRLARKQGVKVLLSGCGGDDLFSGYRRHLSLEYEKCWRWFPRRLRRQLTALAGHLPTNHMFLRRVRKAFSGAHLEGHARLVHYFKWIERADLEALYTPSFKASLAHISPENPMLEFLDSLPSCTPDLERMLALEQRFFLPDHNLTYTDKMSMAVGVEVRVPFLDLDLVQFAVQIPPQFKQRGLQSKWILRKAMEPYLPKDVIYRPKSGFGVPLRQWLKLELRDWLADILAVDRLQRRGLFDPRAVHSLIAANTEGLIDASYTLLSLACIEIWCKHFIDQKASLNPPVTT